MASRKQELKPWHVASLALFAGIAVARGRRQSGSGSALKCWALLIGLCLWAWALRRIA